MWTAAVFFGRVKVMEMVMRCDAGYWWRRLMRLHQLGESFLIKFNRPPAPLNSSSSLPMMATSHKKLSLVYDSVPFRSAPKNYLKSKFLLISKAFYWTFAIFWCEHGKILSHPPFPLPLFLVTTAGTGGVRVRLCDGLSLRIKVACTKPLFSIGQSFVQTLQWCLRKKCSVNRHGAGRNRWTRMRGNDFSEFIQSL